jgi:hypothetical protein
MHSALLLIVLCIEFLLLFSKRFHSYFYILKDRLESHLSQNGRTFYVLNILERNGGTWGDASVTWNFILIRHTVLKVLKVLTHFL